MVFLGYSLEANSRCVFKKKHRLFLPFRLDGGGHGLTEFVESTKKEILDFRTRLASKERKKKKKNRKPEPQEEDRPSHLQTPEEDVLPSKVASMIVPQGFKIVSLASTLKYPFSYDH